MRGFGMVGCSIWRSRKFRALPCESDRLAYIYLLTSSHGNSAGVFVLPPELAAVEMRIPVEDVKRAYTVMNEVGLIRYDASEELIQIQNYFQFNTITSRKHLAGPLKIVRSMPQCWVSLAAACDLVVEIYTRALTWDKTVEARGVFLHEAAHLVKSMHLENLICSQDLGFPKDLLIGLSIDLCIDLPIQGDLNGDVHIHETETYMYTETETYTETENARAGKGGAIGLPALPSESRQSGRNLPQDLKGIIDGMTAKAGPRRK